MRTIVITSLGLNAVLVGAVAYLAVRQPAPEPAVRTPEPAESVVPIRAQRAPKPASAAPTGVGAFHWTQVETADFRQYMDNLRAIGCPEETIRDLIIAEVNKLFAPRFAALAAQTQKFENWNRRSKSRESLLMQLRALQDEKRSLLRELLGIDDDPFAKWANADVDRLWHEGKYSFLSPEKQAQVRAIMDKYDQQLEATRSGRDGLVFGDSDSSKRLRAQREQELAQVLSPDELKELSLRDSNTAESLRSRFGSLDLTEAEYRKLYDLRKAYEDSQGVVADSSDPEKVRQRSEARRQLDEAYQAAFGEDRWNELQKQQDPTWRGLNQLAQQNNIPPATIEQAWQQQRQAGEQLMRVIQDRDMSREQRDATVQQLTAEYDQGLKNLLGDQAYQQYKQNNPGFTFSSGAGDTFNFIGPPGIPGASGRSLTVSPGRTEIRTRIRVP